MLNLDFIYCASIRQSMNLQKFIANVKLWNEYNNEITVKFNLLSEQHLNNIKECKF